MSVCPKCGHDLNTKADGKPPIEYITPEQFASLGDWATDIQMMISGKLDDGERKFLNDLAGKIPKPWFQMSVRQFNWYKKLHRKCFGTPSSPISSEPIVTVKSFNKPLSDEEDVPF
jgi:hypothetical protein